LSVLQVENELGLRHPWQKFGGSRTNLFRTLDVPE